MIGNISVHLGSLVVSVKNFLECIEMAVGFKMKQASSLGPEFIIFQR